MRHEIDLSTAFSPCTARSLPSAPFTRRLDDNTTSLKERKCCDVRVNPPGRNAIGDSAPNRGGTQIRGVSPVRHAARPWVQAMLVAR
jgi:hypothetical protein